jgi:hypothetical protein
MHDAHPSREVRIERWIGRSFYVAASPFRVDLPLDVSGCIAAALRDARIEGHRRTPGGAILASDARRGGSADCGIAPTSRAPRIFVEVERSAVDDPAVVRLDAEILARRLPRDAPRLRPEVDELMRWSNELGHAIAAFYVGFTAAEGPRSFRPTRLFAALESSAVVEPFEVRCRRQYVLSRTQSFGSLSARSR